MNTRWFKRLGWFYVPISIPGTVLSILTVAFWIQIFLAVDRRSHSAPDTLYGVFPFVACSFLLLDWIASRTSQ
ncbi:MAG: hypothetical protein HY043_04680 [Verrucomicrobia bacterium]|nr:hypothetical protein [Verrucomicrobiota bacterium]